MCKISIIVPVYNAEEYIEICIKSIICQDYDNLELILVDDGSRDNSFEICKSYEQKDNRVRAFSKPNGGVSSARNFGMDKAVGDYISFVDSDDYITEDYLSSLLKHMDDETGMVVLGLQKVDESGTITHISHRFNAGKYNYEQLSRVIIDDGTLSGFTIHSSCAILYKREYIERYKIRFNENVKYNEDGLFNTEYILRSGENAYIDYGKAVYSYRTNMMSATKTVDLLGERYLNSMRIVNDVLLSYRNQYTDFDIDKQMIRRDATLALSKMIFLASSGKLNGKEVKNIINSLKSNNTLKTLDVKKMGKGKKLLVYALRVKAYFIVAKILNRKYGNK